MNTSTLKLAKLNRNFEQIYLNGTYTYNGNLSDLLIFYFLKKLADLDEVIPELPKRPAFSKGQLACVFLVDLAIEVPTTSIMPHLPLLLHVIFVQLDHFISLICEQNRSLLINLIQAIIPRDIAHELIDQILITLTEREGKRMVFFGLWLNFMNILVGLRRYH